MVIEFCHSETIKYQEGVKMRTNCMKCVGTIIGFCCVLLIGAILHAQAPTNYRWSEPSGNWGDAMWTDADGAIAGTFTPGEGDTDTFTVDGTVSMN